MLVILLKRLLIVWVIFLIIDLIIVRMVFFLVILLSLFLLWCKWKCCLCFVLIVKGKILFRFIIWKFCLMLLMVEFLVIFGCEKYLISFFYIGFRSFIKKFFYVFSVWGICRSLSFILVILKIIICWLLMVYKFFFLESYIVMIVV